MTIPIIPDPIGSIFSQAGNAIAGVLEARRQHDIEARKVAGESLEKIDNLVKLGILPHDVYQRPDVQNIISQALKVNKNLQVGAGGGGQPLTTLPSASDEAARRGARQAGEITPGSEQEFGLTGVPSPRAAEAGTKVKEATAAELTGRAHYYESGSETQQERATRLAASARLLGAQADLAEQNVLKARNDVETQKEITGNIQKMLADPKSGLSRASAFAALGALPYLTGKQSRDIAQMNRDEQRAFMLGNGALNSAAIEYRDELGKWQTARDNFITLNPNWAKNPAQKKQLNEIDARKPSLDDITATHLHTAYRAMNLDPEDAAKKFGESVGAGLDKVFPKDRQKLMQDAADYIAKLPGSQQEAELRRAEDRLQDPFEAMMLRSMVHQIQTTPQDAAK